MVTNTPLFSLTGKPLDNKMVRRAATLVLEKIIGEDGHVFTFEENAIHAFSHNECNPVRCIPVKTANKNRNMSNKIRACTGRL